MAIDPRHSLPTTSTWFVRTIEHEGQGRAEFSSPPGILEGPATIQVNDAGTVTIRLEARTLTQDGSAVSDSIAEFLFGVTPGELAGPVVVTWLERNVCEKLTVVTDEGAYAAPGDPYYSRRVPGESGAEADLIFTPLTAEYHAFRAGEPCYWVLPLCNLVADCGRSAYEGFDMHPLRIRQAPPVAVDLSDEERQSALLLYRATSPLIAFEHGGRPRVCRTAILHARGEVRSPVTRGRNGSSSHLFPVHGSRPDSVSA